MKSYMFLLLLGIVIYFSIVMPIRVTLCEQHNMTAVWYIGGCVNVDK